MKGKIKILKNGPYRVSGDIKLKKEGIIINEKGESDHWEELKTYDNQGKDYLLCRCGNSKKLPFCDNSHIEENFHPGKDLERETYIDEARKFSGETVDLLDQEDLCVHARFCSKGLGTYNLVKYSASEENLEEAREQVKNCPSGRLSLVDKQGRLLEEDYEKGVSFTEDRATGHYGPLWIKGGIEIVSSQGESYEKRNRVTLCKCGGSKNKPFCDGSHFNKENMKIDPKREV